MKTKRPDKFLIVMTPDEDDPAAFNVMVPALPGCFTFGRSRDEARTHALEAIELYLESLEADDLPIPQAEVLEVELVS